MELKPDRSRQVFSCLGQTIRGSVRPREEHEIGNIRLTHLGGGVLESGSLVQNWDGLHAYAYPPTSLIRACLNNVRTENVDIVLIAPGWPNQEWFPDLLDLAIDFPITLPPVQKLLKQTFSHHLLPHPWNLNLHSIEVFKGFHKERGFSEALAQGLAISQKYFSCGGLRI